MSQDKTDITVETYENIVKKYIEYFKTKSLNGRRLEFERKTFDAIICFATLIHVNDNDCIKILDKFDEILRKNGLIVINVMEWLQDEKEIFEDEPFNPRYKTYFNRYKKEFFTE